MFVRTKFIWTTRVPSGGFYKHGYNKQPGMSLLAKRLAASAVSCHSRMQCNFTDYVQIAKTNCMPGFFGGLPCLLFPPFNNVTHHSTLLSGERNYQVDLLLLYVSCMLQRNYSHPFQIMPCSPVSRSHKVPLVGGNDVTRTA